MSNMWPMTTLVFLLLSKNHLKHWLTATLGQLHNILFSSGNAQDSMRRSLNYLGMLYGSTILPWPTSLGPPEPALRAACSSPL